MFYWLLKYVLVGPWLRLYFRPRVEGIEHIPPSGPLIVAANHPGFFDSFIIPLVLPRPVAFLGKQEYLTKSGPWGKIKAGFFRSANMIPVDRAGGRAALAALETSKRVLTEGGVFAIHPEGTRSPDGRIYRGRTGVARLALATDAVIIPCGINGTDRIRPTGKGLPRPITVHVRFGKPVELSAYHKSDQATLRAITDEIMAEIVALAGREYVEVYASTVKEAAPGQ